MKDERSNRGSREGMNDGSKEGGQKGMEGTIR